LKENYVESCEAVGIIGFGWDSDASVDGWSA